MKIWEKVEMENEQIFKSTASTRIRCENIMDWWIEIGIWDFPHFHLCFLCFFFFVYELMYVCNAVWTCFIIFCINNIYIFFVFLGKITKKMENWGKWQLCKKRKKNLVVGLDSKTWIFCLQSINFHLHAERKMEHGMLQGKRECNATPQVCNKVGL